MIPIYRAKKIGLNNSYIIGFYQQYIEGFQDNIFHEINNTLIDPTTLAIHFPNMLDSQGNKIFASLSKDGKGGDMTNKGICLYEPKYNQFRIIVNLETRTWLEITREDLESYPIKVIGIQE